METLSENKTKYTAFVLTIGLHSILFLFLVLVFFRGTNSTTKSLLDSAKSNYSSDLYVPLEMPQLTSRAIISPTSNTSVKTLTDPSENIPLDHGSENRSEQLNNALLKMKGLKGLNDQNNTTITLKEEKSGTDVSKKPDDPYELSDRILLAKPETINNSNEEGKVVVEIIVDATGRVIHAKPGMRGSTTTSSALYERAMKAALTAKFNHSKEDIAEQRGTYTFVFTLE